uniref:MarR family transcriptional regulator n=1 Tax=Thermosphaera aggregans TaxID=54254 RepID=A0A7C2BJT9_9CREN
MLKQKALTVIIAFMMVLALTPVLNGETAYSISINLSYDLTSNTGIMEIVLDIYDSSNTTMFEIPLMFLGEQAVFSIINITATPEAGTLIYEYNEFGKVLKLITYNTTRVTTWLVAENVTENYAPGVYGFFLDLEGFADIGSASFNLYIYGSHEITVENLGVGSYNGTVYYSNSFTVLQINRPGLYFILILTNIEQIPPTQPSPASGFDISIAVTVILLAIGASGVFVYLWRRRMSVELEAVATRDLLTDEVVRDIIMVLGKAGDKGLQQSELVNLTGRPKSSVSRRIKKLEDEGYVNVVRSGKYNYLRLTDKGLEAFRKIASKERRND